ncbi:MAG TPA: cysteine hydrolase family protein [Opitutaceae bacterium]|nr:cysteine hydrolase family protein [Opitutaceae bacterium]
MHHLPPSSALIVIDVQCGWYLDTPGPHDAAGTLARINTLIDRARAAGRLVIFIQHGETPDYTPGTPDWELHPELHREPGDLVIGKTVCDSFHRTTLDAELQRRSIDTLVLCGAATEFCVDTTIRRAASEGYRVVVPADAHATKDRPVLTSAQIIAHHNWVWAEFTAPVPIVVAPTKEIAFG